MTNTVDTASSEGVKPEDFLTEDEQAVSSDAGTEETQPADETTSETPSDAAELSEGEQSPAQDEGEVSQDDQLFAGKFKNLDALQEAFIELGGDPSEYADTKQLEMAYRAAEKAFHHARQQQPLQDEATDDTPSTDDAVAQALEAVDWDKVKTQGDLIRETVKATLSLVDQKLAGEKARWAVDVQNGLEAREKAKAELGALEARVPRLKTDKGFRDAFGYFVAGQKQTGAYKGLDVAFNTFIAVSKGHAESLAQSRQAQDESKAQAHVSSESAEGLKEPKTADEAIAEDIVSAAKTTNPLFRI